MQIFKIYFEKHPKLKIPFIIMAIIVAGFILLATLSRIIAGPGPGTVEKELLKLNPPNGLSTVSQPRAISGKSILGDCFDTCTQGGAIYAKLIGTASPEDLENYTEQFKDEIQRNGWKLVKGSEGNWNISIGKEAGTKKGYVRFCKNRMVLTLYDTAPAQYGYLDSNGKFELRVLIRVKFCN